MTRPIVQHSTCRRANCASEFRRSSPRRLLFAVGLPGALLPARCGCGSSDGFCGRGSSEDPLSSLGWIVIYEIFFRKNNSVFCLCVEVNKYNFSNFYLKFLLLLNFSRFSDIFTSLKCDFAIPKFQIKMPYNMFMTQISKGKKSTTPFSRENILSLTIYFYIKKKLGTAQRGVG